MAETKERILEFIAKNKRINSQKGMVLLLTGPPGVGKTSIAKSIGECLKRPTTIISMGGQNDPMHIKGSKRTYVDSQPGIFVKKRGVKFLLKILSLLLTKLTRLASIV